MKKVILIVTCLISMITLCGCTSLIETVPVSEYIVCIDGIEYIKYRAGYAGYMSPHLTADEFDNPKVVRCKR